MKESSFLLVTLCLKLLMGTADGALAKASVHSTPNLALSVSYALPVPADASSKTITSGLRGASNAGGSCEMKEALVLDEIMGRELSRGLREQMSRENLALAHYGQGHIPCREQQCVVELSIGANDPDDSSLREALMASCKHVLDQFSTDKLVTAPCRASIAKATCEMNIWSATL